MGIFEVPIVVRNWLNPYLPEHQREEDVACDAHVDTGAAEMCLPAELIDRLKVLPVGTTRGRTADRTVHELRVMGFVEVEVQGRMWHGPPLTLRRGRGEGQARVHG